jgi:prolyl 4-hydroxylase
MKQKRVPSDTVRNPMGNLVPLKKPIGSEVSELMAAASACVSSDVERIAVRTWIADQARSAIPAESVLTALMSKGWDREEAGKVISEAISEYFPGFVSNPFVSSIHSFVIPEPYLADGSSFVDAGDKRVEVILTSMLPRVVVFESFLNDAECDQLIESAKPRLKRSGVIQPVSGDSVVTDIRTSTGMFFNPAEDNLVQKIETRIAKLLNWPVENGEGIQILNYQAGAEYKPHQDFFDPTDASTPTALGFAGQRVGTFLMYLNTPKLGGGTNFPDGGLEVFAKKGRAVFFSYDQPSVLKKCLHGGMPVIEGEKWAATKWLRQRPFQSQDIPLPPISAVN